MWRYNPDSASTRAVRVRADSPEAEEWPSRRPRKLPAAVRREIQRTGQQVARAALPAAVPVVAAVKKAAPVVGKASLAAIVGLASYNAASYIREQVVSGATDPGFIVSMAALRARREMQTKLGRALTSEEVKLLREAIARRWLALEQTMKVAAPFGLGALVNLLRRAL